MAEFVWTRGTPLEAHAVSARIGKREGAAGLTLREISGFDLALVACRRGEWTALKTSTKGRFGVEPPMIPRAVQASNALLVWTGPVQFLVFVSRSSCRLAAELAQRLGDAASVSDQSDARCLLAVSGPRVRDMLAKLISIDLEEAAFPAGSAATTLIDHVGVGFWRGPDDPARYYILCPTSYAGSLWHSVIAAGAEFGVDTGASSFVEIAGV